MSVIWNYLCIPPSYRFPKIKYWCLFFIFQFVLAQRQTLNCCTINWFIYPSSIISFKSMVCIGKVSLWPFQTIRKLLFFFRFNKEYVNINFHLTLYVQQQLLSRFLLCKTYLFLCCTVTIWIPDLSGIWMVDLCPVV